jgi:hypothetical protein
MTDQDDAEEARAGRLYVGVVICEAATITVLWLFGRIFS